jgi:hypothetical protein
MQKKITKLELGLAGGHHRYNPTIVWLGVLVVASEQKEFKLYPYFTD